MAYNIITIKNLMTLERMLLEIDLRYRFDMNFHRAYKLYEYLKKIGSITNYAFLIQEDFHKKYDDKDKLKEYHEKLMDDSIVLEYGEIISFIDDVTESYGDDEFKELMVNLRFW